MWHRLEVEVAYRQRGFLLFPRRWFVEWSFAWMARFRLVRDELLMETLVGLHFIAFATLVAHRFVMLVVQSPQQALVRPSLPWSQIVAHCNAQEVCDSGANVI
jgi:hypothetical protein